MGWKDKEIRKSEFVAMTQFLYGNFPFFRTYVRRKTFLRESQIKDNNDKKYKFKNEDCIIINV